MHTLSKIRELRDQMLTEKAASKYVFAPHGSTAVYICDTLSAYKSIEEIENYMRSYAERIGNAPVNSIEDTDFKLAYDILFGDISEAPLHINDALESAARWRFENSES